MIKTGAVNILVDSYDTPFCIRICLYSLLDGFLMLCHIIVVCVQNNKKSFAIAVIVITAGSSFSVFCIVRIVKMIGVIRIQRIMITDCCCYRKAFQCVCTQIGSVFLFFGFTGFVYLITGGDNKVNIWVFRKSSIESTIPGKTIIFCCSISFTGFVCQLGTILSLTFGSTNLWVTYIEDFYGIYIRTRLSADRFSLLCSSRLSLVRVRLQLRDYIHMLYRR